jgi:hypothetical protein
LRWEGEDSVDWMDLALDTDKWWALLTTVIKNGSRKREEFLDCMRNRLLIKQNSAPWTKNVNTYSKYQI